MNVALEVVGFLLVVAALCFVAVPLGMGAAGVGLIAVANRPPKPRSVDATDPPLR
ncbi:MAG: hypothetical protein WKF86_00095 [Acidimicrobiales bacterium]